MALRLGLNLGHMTFMLVVTQAKPRLSQMTFRLSLGLDLG
jgi:hypothetical protein